MSQNFKAAQYNICMAAAPSSLTHAHGLLSCGFEPVVTDTDIAALSVNAVTVAADVGNFLAFITTCNKTRQKIRYRKDSSQIGNAAPLFRRGHCACFWAVTD